MCIRILPTTLLQIFCENLLNFQIISKSMKIADNTFLGNSECEWVKHDLDELCSDDEKTVLVVSLCR